MKKIVLLMSALALSNLTNAQNYQEKQEKIIRERIDQFVDDVNTSNIDGFVDAFSDKLYSAESKEGIKKSVQQRDQVYDIEYSIHLKDVSVDKKMAYEEGWYRSVLIPKNGGDRIVQEFDFLDVWELEGDGKWRIIKALKVERPLKEYKSNSELEGELALIVGKYKTEKLEVEVKVNSKDEPVLIVGGGNPITLIQNTKLVYDLKGVPGAQLRFEIESGEKAQKAIMKQATGEVIATRI